MHVDGEGVGLPAAGGLLGQRDAVMPRVFRQQQDLLEQLRPSLDPVPLVRSRPLDHGVHHKLIFGMTTRCLLSLAARPGDKHKFETSSKDFLMSFSAVAALRPPNVLGFYTLTLPFYYYHAKPREVFVRIA